MQFIIYCKDKPDALELRMATRPAHLAFIEATPLPIVLAGPLLGEDGAMRGSMFIVEADDLAAAQRFSAADPYRIAGLFASVEIHGFRTVVSR